MTVHSGGRAVALRVTEGFEPPDACATIAFAPGVLPTVHPPTEATPDAFVATVAPVTDPPPFATENVTVTPDMGAPLWSRTITPGAVGTAVPIRAV
jgi:hypothetical protein